MDYLDFSVGAPEHTFLLLLLQLYRDFGNNNNRSVKTKQDKGDELAHVEECQLT